MDATTIDDDTYPDVPVREKYTIGIPRSFLKEGVDVDVMEVFQTHVAELIAAGHTVVDIELPLFEKRSRSLLCFNACRSILELGTI